MPASNARSTAAAAGGSVNRSLPTTIKKKAVKSKKQRASVTTVGDSKSGFALEPLQRITFEDDNSEHESDEKNTVNASAVNPLPNQPFVVDISELLRAQ